MDYSNITKAHFDTLKEVFNIGAGNAATSLSQILGKRVEMMVPNSALIGLDDLLRLFGDEEKTVLGIMILLEGDIAGFMVFMMPKQGVIPIVSLLLGRDYPEDCVFDEMDMSTMEEIGNIIVSSYINSLASMTGFSIRISQPFSAVDMAASILSVPLSEVGKYGDNVLFMESIIKCDGLEVEGHFLMLPTVESYEKLMKALGM